MWRILAIVLLVVFVPIFAHAASNHPAVPCYFVFGDSLSDPGNNNNLNTTAKANYPPYGVDFPGGVTGRFTNGRTYVDILGELLGFKSYIPPFSNTDGQNISLGVNYASGAAGIRNESGSHLGDRIWLDRQLRNHATTISNLESLIKGSSIPDYLSKCLYTVNIGSNDYINNYFMPQHYSTKSMFTPDQYATALISQYTQLLQELYETGARKVGIFGIGPIGCTPAEIAINKAIGCVNEINKAVNLFNKKLKSAVADLNARLLGAKFSFVDTPGIQVLSPIIALVTSPCCKLRSDYQCEPSVRPCFIRSLHPFMDGFHPTEAVNVLAAANAYATLLPTLLPRSLSV